MSLKKQRKAVLRKSIDRLPDDLSDHPENRELEAFTNVKCGHGRAFHQPAAKADSNSKTTSSRESMLEQWGSGM